MKIVNKALDLFIKKGVTKEFFMKNIDDVTFRCRIESPIRFSICRSKNRAILTANICWAAPFGTEETAVSKNFINTWQGFYEACEWLDSKRVEFAESLL